MTYGESIGHMIDDVTWPRKVMVVTQLSLRPIISKTPGDKGLVTMEEKYKIGYGESNGHVTDDVRWPWKVKVVTQLSLGHNISKTPGDTGLVTTEDE